MGLAKYGRFNAVIGFLVAVAISVATWSCSSDKRGTVSQQSFLAPQLIAVDPTTGQNSQGKRAVEVVVDKVAVLREVHRQADGFVPFLDSELRAMTASIIPFGKLSVTILLIEEADSRTLLTVNLETNAVLRVATQEEFLGIFNGVTPRPTLGPVIELKNGWLLGFEVNSRSLFAIRLHPNGLGGIIMQQVLNQAEIRDQILPPQGGASARIRSMVEFARTDDIAGDITHVFVIPVEPQITALHHLRIENNAQALDARFVLPDGVGLVEFEQISNVTGNTAVNVRDCPPVVIPGTSQIVLFDRGGSTAATFTSSFLGVDIRRGQDLVYRSTVRVLVNRTELTQLIQPSIVGGVAYTGDFEIASAFLHPDSLLPAGDPNRKTLILNFDKVTNNIIGFDYSKSFTAPDKVRLVSTSAQITNRTDLNRDPILDVGTFDLALAFARNDVLNNRLVNDDGPDEIVSFNFETGQFVVVLHKRDIAAAVDPNSVSAPVKIIYIEALDPPPGGDGKTVRIIDEESSSILAVSLEYLPIPVVWTAK